MLKNAVRAVVESHPGVAEEALPAVRVVVARGLVHTRVAKKSVSIKPVVIVSINKAFRKSKARGKSVWQFPAAVKRVVMFGFA